MKRDVVVIAVAVAAVTLVSLVPPAAGVSSPAGLALRAVAGLALAVIVVVFYDLVSGRRSSAEGGNWPPGPVTP